MTPLQFAQQFCANYQSGGSCLGAWIVDDGKITSCSPKPKCVLPARCRYFEECVAPNAQRFPAPLAQAALSAVLDYRRGLSQPVKAGPAERTRRCQCGNLLKPKHQLCLACKKARRRATWRRQKQQNLIPTI
ncbi:MAG: hypothetical protein KJ072_27110 [Verrucomicrobia bacterium]|nr:hypothetical protein [Verrucomicrobiota bacterium]